jgi:type VI secretion system protein ImpL
MLRGFYFTGVRPIIVNETAPVAAAAPPQAGGYGSVAGATGIFTAGGRAQAAAAPPPQVGGARKVPQWLFLSRLFNDILLSDRTAMGASGASTRTNFARRMLFLAAAALCLLLSILFTVSFFKNRGLETRVRTAAESLAASGPAGVNLAPADSLRKLETLRQSLESLIEYRRDGAPIFYRMGLYAGNSLYPEAWRIYFDRFRQLLFLQTQNAMLQALRGLPATPGPEYGPTYDALKAYLITTSYHEHSSRQFLSPVLMKWWAASSSPRSNSISTPTRSRTRIHTRRTTTLPPSTERAATWPNSPARSASTRSCYRRPGRPTRPSTSTASSPDRPKWCWSRWRCLAYFPKAAGRS